MPRPAKGPRVYFNRSEGTYIIRDGAYAKRTGCGEGDRDGADRALGAYLAEKFRPAVRQSNLTQIPVAEVLTAYGREHAPSVRAPATIGYAIAALVPWWGDRTLADVRKETCKAYTAARGKTVKPGTIRRELGVLGAAINHWHEEHGPLESVPIVTLPEKSGGRIRWLTRQEAALLLAGALGFYRAFSSDIATRRVSHRWERYAGGINRHLARFILLGLYSGTRRGAMLDLQWMPSITGGWVDLERGVLHRSAIEEAQTKKRKPPARLGRKILAHLARWKRIDEAERDRAAAAAGESVNGWIYIVTWKGRGVSSVRTSWEAAVELAWLDRDVTPHVLRHTRATWMMQQSIDMWEASGSLGMSVKTLEDVYGHHHPDFQKNAAEV